MRFLCICICVCVQESETEVQHLQQLKEELSCQIRDLSVPLKLTSDSVPELKKHLRELESRDKERSEEISQMTARITQHEQVHTPEHSIYTRPRALQWQNHQLSSNCSELYTINNHSQSALRGVSGSCGDIKKGVVLLGCRYVFKSVFIYLVLIELYKVKHCDKF